MRQRGHSLGSSWMTTIFIFSEGRNKGLFYPKWGPECVAEGAAGSTVKNSGLLRASHSCSQSHFRGTLILVGLRKHSRV